MKINDQPKPPLLPGTAEFAAAYPRTSACHFRELEHRTPPSREEYEDIADYCSAYGRYVQFIRSHPKPQPMISLAAEMEAELAAVKAAFVALHSAWLGACHRSDMNAEMDALAVALRLHPHTLEATK